MKRNNRVRSVTEALAVHKQLIHVFYNEIMTKKKLRNASAFIYCLYLLLAFSLRIASPINAWSNPGNQNYISWSLSAFALALSHERGYYSLWDALKSAFIVSKTLTMILIPISSTFVGMQLSVLEWSSNKDEWKNLEQACLQNIPNIKRFDLRAALLTFLLLGVLVLNAPLIICLPFQDLLTTLANLTIVPLCLFFFHVLPSTSPAFSSNHSVEALASFVSYFWYIACNKLSTGQIISPFGMLPTILTIHFSILFLSFARITYLLWKDNQKEC